MQSTAPAPGVSSPAPVPLPLSPTGLAAALAGVPDPRRRHGTRHALPAILAMAVAAILSNHLSVLAIAERGADKAEGELTVAPALLARVDWRGRALTGDALVCQRPLCRQVVEAGGDHLLLVKENQPTLHHDIQLLFDPPPGSAPLPLLD